MMKANTLLAVAPYLFFSTQGNPFCNSLHQTNNCGSSELSICISDSDFSNAKSEYKLLSIHTKGTFKTGGIISRKHTYDDLLLTFNYRITGSKLFYLTNHVDPVIDTNCEITETPIFCLNDSIGQVRTIGPNRCESIWTSQFLGKAITNSDTLYTYKISFIGINISHSPQIPRIVFNRKFQIKEMDYDSGATVFIGYATDRVVTFK